MSEQSIWKKEISFRRKPKDKSAKLPDVPGEEQTSIWKKEISFRRKTTPRAAQGAETKPSIWRKEITLGRRQEPAAESVAAEPTQAPDPIPAPASASAPAVVPEPQPEPQPEAQAVADEEPWESEPELPAAPEPVEEPTVEVPAPVAAAPVAPEVIHPPVPAAELPPLPDEDGEKAKPFWRREVVIGRRPATKAKADPPAETSAPKAAKAKREKKVKTPKVKTPKVKAPRVKAERGGKGKKLVGLKIGASQLAAARVTNNGAAELLQVAREPLSPGVVVGGELRDPDALAIALKDFFSKHKLPKRGVRLGIANNRIGVRMFEIGGIDDQKQLDNAIRFRAQEALPIPIDEAVLDYQVLGQVTNDDGERLQRILLVVAYREQIDRYVEACRKAGIALIGIDLEAFALLRALQAPQEGAGGDPSAALVAVAIGHERSTFAVSDGRVCEFTRVLEWGGAALNVAIARALDAAPSEVEAVKRALSLSDNNVPEGLSPEQAAKARDALRRAIQAFARELVSSLQFYQNQPGSLGIGEIVLTGGTTHLPGLAAELERLIGVHVRVGDPLARMKVSKKLGEPEQLGSYAVAIGLGIED
jgi:type IV pilus assembly protein PilM